MKNVITFAILFIAFLFVMNANATNPIHANGKFIIGSCGDTITLRGVNYAAFNWGWDLTDDRFAQIALSGANCIRIPWYSSSAAGGGAPVYNNLANLDSAISKCVRNKMIPILVLMDNTCNADTGALLTLSNYYLQPSVVSIINTFQNSLIIDIANEALYHNWANNPTLALSQFKNTYKAIITNMRNAGILVPLM